MDEASVLAYNRAALFMMVSLAPAYGEYWSATGTMVRERGFQLCSNHHVLETARKIISQTRRTFEEVRHISPLLSHLLVGSRPLRLCDLVGDGLATKRE